MPVKDLKCKTKAHELAEDAPMQDLIANLKNAEEEIKTMAEEVKPEGQATGDLDAKRRELIKSSEDGEIDQSVKYLQKASANVIEKNRQTNGRKETRESERIYYRHVIV